MTGRPFSRENQPNHDRANCGRANKRSPWRTVGCPWLGKPGAPQERITAALNDPRNRRRPPCSSSEKNR